MKRLLRKLKTGIFLTPRQKKMFLAVFFLSIYRNILLVLGSKKAFSEHISKKQNPETLLNPEKMALAKDVAVAITLANKYIPWKNVCRHQSWQAIILLLKYQIPFEYFVGIHKTKTIKEGHSWVKVNQNFVCGKCNEKNYLIIHK